MGYSQPAQIINKTFEVANEKSREGTEKFITAYKEKKKQDFPHNPTRVDEEKKKQEELDTSSIPAWAGGGEFNWQTGLTEQSPPPVVPFLPVEEEKKEFHPPMANPPMFR